MLNRSLFICYSTPNYSKLTHICLESLNSINVKNIIHKIDNPSILYQITGFQTDLWYYCIRNKISHLIDVISNSCNSIDIEYFIFTDCDIVYVEKNINEWHNLEKFITNENKDVYFMRESRTNNVNSGFFIIKNNNNIKNIINFFVEVLQTIDTTEKRHMPLGDQSIINKLKNKINYGFIPNDYVIFGNTIYNIDKSLFHHAVCCRDVDEKIIQINQIKSRFNCAQV